MSELQFNIDILRYMGIFLLSESNQVSNYRKCFHNLVIILTSTLYVISFIEKLFFSQFSVLKRAIACNMIIASMRILYKYFYFDIKMKKINSLLRFIRGK